MTKIALIADIHHGPQSHTKVAGWDALRVVREFVDFANDVRADLLVDLGDRISDTTVAADVAAAGEVAAALAGFAGPRIHLLGNHDVEKLSAEDNATLLGQPMRNRVVDLGDLRVIAFQPDVRMVKPTGFAPVSAEDIAWLVETLSSDERPAVIVSHLPLSGHSQMATTTSRTPSGSRLTPTMPRSARRWRRRDGRRPGWRGTCTGTR
jgi:Icc protein